jgi:cysteine desulfurase NifS/selenium donor protein
MSLENDFHRKESKMPPIYLDYNATTPILPEVAEAMRPFLSEFFGNPSSTHWYGLQTKKAIEKSRQQVASLLDCHPAEIIFTSGGSESNNFAIKGVAFAQKDKGNHIISSQIEHPAVTEVCEYLKNWGFEISYVPVNDQGIVELSALEEAIKPTTILITVMHANNEVGTIQPIAEIAKIAKNRGIIFHSDAAQSVGKIPTSVKNLNVDLLSIAGHKLYAPKGVGALYIKKDIVLEKQIHGANHEGNLRAGTENILEIAGLGKACELVKKDLEKNYQHLKEMRDRLTDGLKKNLKEVVGFRTNGHPDQRLPNTASISFANLEANTILSEIEERVAVSAGAACHSDRVDLSPTLEAMKVPMVYAMGTIRFSTGKFTTINEIDEVIKIVSETVKRLQPDASNIVQTGSDVKDIKLTHFTHGLGCACKLRPQALEKILLKLPLFDDKNILIGTKTADDAAIYRLDDDRALVQTVDFFTPIVDDPFQFGAIAAANALSDIYAMGGKPLFALNIVGFPSNRLPLSVLEQILIGAQKKAEEAGISIIGGHTIDDTEPKYGLSVCGIVHPDKIKSNASAQPGDKLILTKPLGTGILTTALKRGLLDDETEKKLVNTMETLNAKGAEIMEMFRVHACTDVTGFGCLGHLKEISTASEVDAEIDAGKVPLLDNLEELVMTGVVPGGTENNLLYLADWIEWSGNVSDSLKIILCDAQTSGGLLISVHPDDAESLFQRLQEENISAARIIGSMTKRGKGIIRVH